MTKDAKPRPAKDIPVKAFRQIFHLPLSLAKPDRDGQNATTQVDKVVKALKAEGWEDVDLRETLNTPEGYAEAVYFHDFVCDFLYPESGKAEGKASRRRSLSHSTMVGKSLTFQLSADVANKTAFKIEKLDLDLFDFGVAILTLQVLCQAPLTLADAQTLIDHNRRAFAGFWIGEHPGLCPASVTLEGSDPWVADSQKAATKFRAKNGQPRLFPWWRELIKPLRLAGDDGPADAPEWRNVLDERIPVMTYLSLSRKGWTGIRALGQVSEGDWFRIAGADQADTDPMPYNAEFLRAQSDHLFYDRHFPSDGSTSSTRHCFAGYHYAVVGADDDGTEHPAFDDYIATHFQRHYRQMQFIAQFEFAALLTFSRRLTNLVEEKREKRDEDAFRENLMHIRSDFLDFTHRYVFTQVSNHLQAREMNSRLRTSIGLDDLRRDVEQELSAASDFALALEQRDIAKDQDKAAKSQTLLTNFATLFLPATLGVGAGGMNILAGVEEGEALVSAGTVAQLFFWMFLAYGLGWGVFSLVRNRRKVGHDPEADWLWGQLGKGSLLCLVVAFVCCMIANPL